MVLSPLDAVLKKLRLSDSAFAAKCGKHRTEIWAYRHLTRSPNTHTSVAIVAALRKLGVEMAVEDLLCKRPSKKAA